MYNRQVTLYLQWVEINSESLSLSMDNEHTKAKSLILCGRNSNLNPK
jgi:hypothetical protein